MSRSVNTRDNHSPDGKRSRSACWQRLQEAIDALAATDEWKAQPAPTYEFPWAKAKLPADAGRGTDFTKMSVTFMGYEMDYYFRVSEKGLRSIGQDSYTRDGSFNESKAGAKAILSDFDTDFDYPTIASAVLHRAKSHLVQTQREAEQKKNEKRIARTVHEITGTKPTWSRVDVAGCDPVDVTFRTWNGDDKFTIENLSEADLRVCIAALRASRKAA